VALAAISRNRRRVSGVARKRNFLASGDKTKGQNVGEIGEKITLIRSLGSPP
jgi:hypothetical protein